MTTNEFNSLNDALKAGQNARLAIYDEDDNCIAYLRISIPETLPNIKDNKDVEAITPAQKNRLYRFLSMPEVSDKQKIWLRAYLAAKRLSKAGARKVIHTTILQLRAKGIYLNRPNQQDVSVLFSDEMAFGD
jgi:hypothetical protein